MFRELPVSEPSESVMMVPMVETVMWVQREKKMFPRWKERVVVINGEELYCYKKGCAQLSDVCLLDCSIQLYMMCGRLLVCGSKICKYDAIRP